MLNAIQETSLSHTTSNEFPNVKLPEQIEPLTKPFTEATRKVQFVDAHIVCFLKPSSSMSAQERNEMWYQTDDLDEFKAEARDLCRKLRVSPDNEAISRGLEHRVSLERQKNKALAIRCILKAQRRFANPEHVAMVARKCTTWAKEVALVEASRDFCDTYHPALKQLIPEVASSSEFPFQVRKREAEDDEAERSVRRRGSFH